MMDSNWARTTTSLNHSHCASFSPGFGRQFAGARFRLKAFGLLVTLAMEPGRVFGRQDLLDAVWGEEIIVDERTVDVHISWLRGKLIDAGIRDELIRTVYGAGYRFVV